jgi:glutamate---cysteine ligase / carboxylate-amine ligase
MEHTITPPQTPATVFTMGVEEEYQLVDTETGALRSHASALRAEDWTGELLAELQETTIEIGTPISSSSDEVLAHLQRLRFQAATVAASNGVAIVAAALHPFSAWEGHTRPALERYRAIEERYGRIARDEHIFGMHIHVGLPPEVDRLRVLNIVRHQLPLLLALSASSPFFEGADTGFASFRTILWRRWPSSGIPPRFADDAEFRQYVDALLDAGVMADPWNLYWSARPHPKYPTIEIRVTDVCPSVQDAAAIAALTRAIVYAAATGVLQDDALENVSPVMEQELLRVNEWRVARDGMNARIIDACTGATHQPVRAAIGSLLDRIGRCAGELGDAGWLNRIATIVERGNAADRMRRHHADAGTLKSVVDWLAQESLAGTGVDRRAVQRGDS